MIAADRALLELAAKAAGIAVVRSRLHDPARQDFLIRGSARNPSQDLGPWNPLADDGDALRLAVTLRMLVGPGSAMAPRFDVIFADGDDVAAATRRAIVQAAAAIGRAMP